MRRPAVPEPISAKSRAWPDEPGVFDLLYDPAVSRVTLEKAAVILTFVANSPAASAPRAAAQRNEHASVTGPRAGQGHVTPRL